MIRNDLESDIMIRSIHDVKATDMGGSTVMFKAEADIDGRESKILFKTVLFKYIKYSNKKYSNSILFGKN